MSTAQMQRTQEKTSTWSAIFPNETVTEQQSTLFVKKLVAVAVSNIAYLRAIFPEHSFGDRCLEDLNLKILRDDSSCPGACQVIKWVKGCFDAIEKKYLRMLIIGTVIESYTFKFSYTNNGGIDIYRNDKKISSAYSASETKKATIRLLRTIVVLTQTLKSLPDDVMMTMKLLYFDDLTPGDYEPPGFKAAQTDSFQFEEEPMNIKVGDVTTFEMKDEDVDGNKEETTEPEITSVNVQDDIMDDETQKLKTHNMTKQRIDKSTEAVVPSESPEIPGSDEMAVDTTGSQRSQESEIPDLGVRCPCGVNEDDGLMILCAVCKYWQHGICFLIKDEDEAPQAHFCDVCSEIDSPDKQPTDPYLCGLSSIAVQATCLWRRTLTAVPELSRVLAPNLAKRLGVEVSVAQGLMNRLEKEGFIKSSGKNKKLGKIVDKEKVKIDGFKKYLTKKTTEKPTVDTNMNEETEDDGEFKKPLQKKDINKSIEQLSAMTEDIELSRPKKKGRRGKKQKETKKNIEVESAVVHPCQENEPKKSRKRAISKVDETEFDLADSQMDSQDFMEDKNSSKKKKASIVSKAIMV
ncbi:HORMA domain-containing protein 1,HORMA domain-containing protein 2 [Mytilus coruscus]|uniref:HORMA domain-containing protein 1,HORMA domain-containing protein 2 n=1 Tax=Mytilus coruscus TaxID=42192 RepID=A0A6J8A6T5_MYTCO|nr:HORMA domain-containing protein 1,HORMA domain-containing protein 2 [Mytilus coruscus]